MPLLTIPAPATSASPAGAADSPAPRRLNIVFHGLMAFHASRRQRGINVSGRFIVGTLIEDQLVAGDSNPGAWFEGYGHDHPLVIDERSIATAKIHDLILETVVTTHNGMLA